MPEYAFPRKPYDAVESPFVREQIRQGSFWDLPHRRYVNELVWLEWYTSDADRSTMSGISAFGCCVHHYRIGARWPEAYDAVRSDLSHLLLVSSWTATGSWNCRTYCLFGAAASGEQSFYSLGFDDGNECVSHGELSSGTVFSRGSFRR